MCNRVSRHAGGSCRTECANSAADDGKHAESMIGVDTRLLEPYGREVWREGGAPVCGAVGGLRKAGFSLIGVDNSLLEANGRGGLEGRGRTTPLEGWRICRAGALEPPRWWPKALVNAIHGGVVAIYG